MVSDDDVNAFSEPQKIENTKKKTLDDLKIFREFHQTCDDKREVELQAMIKMFVLAVRKKKKKKKKKNGDQEEPSSIRAFL